MAHRQIIATTMLALLALTSGCANTQNDTPTATALEVNGSLDAHDPSLIIDDAGTPDTNDDVWYVYSTGNGAIGLGSPQVRRSEDQGTTWEDLGPAWTAADEPYWAREIITGVDNFWAPEVVEHDGTYYMYYSASTFGSSTSLIGLYTNTTLDPQDPNYRWEDQGEVLRSTSDSTVNAIDPGISADADGNPWMVYGSFWDGLVIVPLEWPSGKLPGQAETTDDPLAASGVEPQLIAQRGYAPNAIEAGFLYQRDGWYYLFFSRDSCCKGTDSTYNMAVGRSQSITGPYVDANDVPLTEDGGLPLLSTTGNMIGPGGQSVARSGEIDVLAYHYYDADLGGQFQLALRELAWDDNGWPIATTDAERQAQEANASVE
ncbi:arabinan endo-1,5-alpha-L-arabinosidase [Jonesia quinghaiensis]|uniref:arabinan endo-1,5-alpha-L-arabinosidase n=1 Tax=Jonesia quinghaiensis TaxID=262806 RepID=UPI0004293B40|nr:arabinan endo-1,5-alpha-L-arabinosidase [Jonesia quinghaiensis]